MLKDKTKVAFYNIQNNHAVDLKQINRNMNIIIIFFLINLTSIHLLYLFSNIVERRLSALFYNILEEKNVFC